MRLYISKKEAYSIQFALMNEIQKLSKLLSYDATGITFIYEKIRILDSINCRIENCLMLQKSGYNRKEK